MARVPAAHEQESAVASDRKCTHGRVKIAGFGHLFDPNTEHPQLLDQLKQISLYTDCLNNGHWSVPDEVVDMSLSKMLVEVAEVLCQSYEVTAEEIELWTLHLQLVYHTTAEAMERALMISPISWLPHWLGTVILNPSIWRRPTPTSPSVGRGTITSKGLPSSMPTNFPPTPEMLGCS